MTDAIGWQTRVQQEIDPTRPATLIVVRSDVGHPYDVLLVEIRAFDSRNKRSPFCSRDKSQGREGRIKAWRG
jgi:hypothetical protein